MASHMGANGTGGSGAGGGNFSHHDLTPAQRQQLEAQQRVLSPQQVGTGEGKEGGRRALLRLLGSC